MRSVGIICEYNPLHLGHARQISVLREAGYGAVVCLMSGNAVQRGGFACTDSRSNFLFAESSRKDGGTLYRKLKEKGVLVRHFDAPRIANRLRITIGTPEQMQALVETLDKILEE